MEYTHPGKADIPVRERSPGPRTAFGDHVKTAPSQWEETCRAISTA